MKPIVIILGVIVAAVVAGAILVAGSYRSTYNNLVGLREQVDAAASEVRNVCQRQADLIPNLATSLKSYAAHESAVLTAVTEARSKFQRLAEKTPAQIAESKELQKQIVEAQRALQGTLVSVSAVAERYPDLKASELYRDFNAQLEGAQNRITYRRGEMIDKTRAYNSVAKGLVTSFVFGAKFPPLDYYEGEVGDKSSVEVKL